MFTKCSSSSSMFRIFCTVPNICAFHMFRSSEHRYSARVSGTISRDTGLNNGWQCFQKRHHHLLRKIKLLEASFIFLLPFFCVYKMSESIMIRTQKILKHLFGVILCLRPTIPGRKPPKCDTRHISSISKCPTGSMLE